MPTKPMPAEVREFLALPNPAVMATLRKSGRPVTVATWYLMDGDEILFNLDGGRTRLAHLRNDPRISLTAMGADDWYSHVSIQGTVVRIADDEGLADIDRLAEHYTGNPYRVRNRARVSVWCSVDSWHGWGRFVDAR